MKRAIAVCLLTIPLFFAAGCSHITMLRTQELRAVQAHVDSLNAQLGATQAELLKQQKEQNELVRLIRADQQVKLAEISDKISSLQGNISESQQRLSMIDKKTQEIKQSWDEKARSDSLAQAQKASEVNKLFQIAHDDFVARRYDVAMGGLKDLKAQAPDSPLADDATYWIAECSYAQAKYDDAEQAFKNYLKEYKDGKYRCTALYKLGKVYELTKKEKAKSLVWKSLIDKCPESEEAKVVKAQAR